MSFTIYGRIPSKKNSTISFVRGGRIHHIPSNKYREWHKEATSQLRGIEKLNNKHILGISVLFFAPDKRKADLTNKAESINDLLVDNNIIPDDNWFELPEVSLKFGGVDVTNPRAEITIQWQEKK